MRTICKILFVALVLISCGRDLPKLDGIDMDKWKDDRNACGGYRISTVQSLHSEMAKLKGLSEMDVIRLLGKPEQNELYKRNQKFYSYFVSPGGVCQNKDSVEHKLILRFNAMGYAQLVSME